MLNGEPGALLAGLDPSQVEAVRITRGPVVIHAGAGSGKTRVVTHRVAYAVATGAVDPRRILVVTFTDKAAGEMTERLAALGFPRIAARTFHAAALAQLRHFWPRLQAGQPAPAVLDSKIPIVGRLARALPGGYRFTRRRTSPTRSNGPRAGASGRPPTPARQAIAVPPIPVELFVRLWAGYEREKDRVGPARLRRHAHPDGRPPGVDDAAAAETVRARYGWFSVDEYQDTNPLQQRLLDLWLGDRDDLCVVGDEDQTIYTFAGATSAFLAGFTLRFPTAREVTLDRNYRSSPEILALANRLLAAEGRRKRLVATRPSGPKPAIRRCADAIAELDLVVATIRRLIREGVAPAEIAVLVRVNAQVPPVEAALTKAGIAFRVRGQRFFERQEVREALRLVRRLPPAARGIEVLDALEARLRSELGFDPDAARAGAESRERTASLALILEIASEIVDTDAFRATADQAVARARTSGDLHPGGMDGRGLLAELEGRAAAEAAGSLDGVNLLTLHRAKGLEWDAVLLPGLEEGTLPIRQAVDDDAVAEERRLFYVGLTRARRHLLLSWAERRASSGDRESRRRPSRFLRALEAPGTGAVRLGAGTARPAGESARDRAGSRSTVRASGVTVLPGAPMPSRSTPRPSDDALLADLRAWRTERARRDKVPAYVIAHDAVLLAVVEERPTSAAALRRVRGMGPAKLDRYGNDILAIVARH